MNTVQIMLTCPECGNSNWEVVNNCEFKCLKCGTIASPEAMCSVTKDVDGTDWFGTVRWCEADLKAALEYCDCPPTENNVAELRRLCEHHSFEDNMTESGWFHIYELIEDMMHYTF